MVLLKQRARMHNSQEGCSLDLEAIFQRMCHIICRISVIKRLIFVWVLLYAVPNLYAGSKPFEVSHVKAVFLYNLANFVSWPSDSFDGPTTPLRICILGDDPFGIALDKTVQNEIVKGRQIVVERVSDVTDLCGCHILFISSSMKAQLSQVLKVTSNCSVLTVGDVEGFARLGGIVNLIHKGGRVYLEINVDSAARVALRISSKLLNLARIVRNERSVEND
jgi:hypothetical protein